MSRPVLVLLGKPDCGLCHEMRAVVEPVARERGFDLLERDVREDPALEKRYLFEIPVLLAGGREVARHRITPDALRARLAALAVESDSKS